MDNTNFKINWIDGMKITKEHFQDLQNYTENGIKNALVNRKSRFDYGISRPRLRAGSNFSITLDTHKNLKISIKRLLATTPDGNRIAISDRTPTVDDDIAITDLVKNKSERGFLMLNLDAQHPVAFGEPDPKEVPPRLPFLADGYFFSYVDAEELGKMGVMGNQLPIAKIENDGQNLSSTSDYIPPCTSVDANDKLIAFYDRTDAFLKKAEQDVIAIARKIKARQNENPIADAMFMPVDKSYSYLAQQITNVKWKQYEMHPRDLLEIVVTFARLFKGSIDMSSPEDKEQLFNYFGDWTDLKGGDYEKTFNNIINLKYDHLDVNDNIKSVTNFMNTIGALLNVLTQVDYIGQRRDMGIFVNENKVMGNSGTSDTSNTAAGTSFLAE
ncbi:hypothetical protein RQM65_18330 [Pricia sp. S334]|uniref:Type VI secretion system baseplate subunit TssK n=1 Tax=Pricia mediterranea TaxID=3076079 RepID=A0ABU3LBN4_9FLAO|nr:hypothetical protein [Pricia sp. S334]MDT7830633.1 hypothetical protein [Pricia sp. S334]